MSPHFRLSVGLLVGRSVGRSVGWSVMISFLAFDAPPLIPLPPPQAVEPGAICLCSAILMFYSAILNIKQQFYPKKP